MKVSGKNLVKRQFQENTKEPYIFDFSGDPASTRTRDLLLRRTRTAFSAVFLTYRKHLLCLVKSKAYSIFQGPVNSSEIQLFSKVSGKNLVNSCAIIFGPDPPI